MVRLSTTGRLTITLGGGGGTYWLGFEQPQRQVAISVAARARRRIGIPAPICKAKNSFSASEPAPVGAPSGALLLVPLASGVSDVPKPTSAAKAVPSP